MFLFGTSRLIWNDKDRGTISRFNLAKLLCFYILHTGLLREYEVIVLIFVKFVLSEFSNRCIFIRVSNNLDSFCQITAYSSSIVVRLVFLADGSKVASNSKLLGSETIFIHFVLGLDVSCVKNTIYSFLLCLICIYLNSQGISMLIQSQNCKTHQHKVPGTMLAAVSL